MCRFYSLFLLALLPLYCSATVGTCKHQNKVQDKVIILSEDFSKFTSGSFESPDDNNDIAWSGISDFMQTPGWDGESLYSAGGICYIGMGWFFPGNLITPAFDGSVNEGCYTLSFRVCGTADDKLTVSRGDTKKELQISTTWETIEIEFTDGSDGDKIKFYPDAEPMYIDDIVVYYSSGETEILPEAPEGSVLFEHFGGFTEGTEQAPARLSDDNTVVPDDKMLQPGWSGAGIYDAGGCAYIGAYGEADAPKQGYLTTPVLDLSSNGGKFTVTFKAREYEFGFGFGYINVGLFDAETKKQIYNNYAEMTDKWTDCSIEFSNGTAKCYLQFTSGIGEAYIDNIAVIQAVSSVPAPVALGWDNLSATGFTINWQPVEEADSYLLSVFEHGQNSRIFTFEDKAVDGTNYEVEGVDTTKPYYFTVKAVSGEKVSVESNEVRVLGLVSPVTLEASDVTSTGFKANWEQSERATAYLLTVYQQHTASDSESYSFIDEDFSGFNGGTIAEPMESSLLDGTIDAYISRAGWTVRVLAWCDGALGLDNRYSAEYGNSSLCSPSLDFSHGNGDINLTINHYGRNVKTFTITLHDNTGNIIDSKELNSISEWYEENVTLHGGSDNCFITIEVPSTEKGVLFISSLRVAQNLTGGESVTIPYFGAEITPPYNSNGAPLSKEVSIDSYNENDTYSYGVKARRVYSDYYTVEYIYSKESQRITVPHPTLTGLTSYTVAASIGLSGNTVTVQAPENTDISIFNVSGRLIAKKLGGFSMALPEGAIYIIVIDGKATKICL